MTTAADEIDDALEESTELAPEQPELPPVPPDDCPDHVREHYRQICAKEREVRDLENEYLDAKEAAGEAKKSFEAADKALRNLISRGADYLPLFDPPEAAPEAWRTASIGELLLTDKVQELLVGAGVETIGQLEDLRAKTADHKAEWPKGIGPGKVTDIENKVIDWLTANRDKFGQPEVAEAATDAPADGGTVELFVAGKSAGRMSAQEAATTIIDGCREKFAAEAKSNGSHKPRNRAMAGRPAPKTKKKGKRK